MRKLLRPRKRGTLVQELVAAVAQTVFWMATFATFRGGMSVFLPPQPPAYHPDLFALFSPTFGAVCLLAGPLLAVASFSVKWRLTPKG